MFLLLREKKHTHYPSRALQCCRNPHSFFSLHPHKNPAQTHTYGYAHMCMAARYWYSFIMSKGMFSRRFLFALFVRFVCLSLSSHQCININKCFRSWYFSRASLFFYSLLLPSLPNFYSILALLCSRACVAFGFIRVL